MIIGERIDLLLKERGISQAELARRVGVKQPSIFKLIHENKSGSRYLPMIARELDTTAAFLLGETDDPSGDLVVGDRLSSEERDWVDLLRALVPDDRKAALRLVRSLAHSASSPRVQGAQQDFGR